jgi:hypothetical protein
MSQTHAMERGAIVHGDFSGAKIAQRQTSGCFDFGIRPLAAAVTMACNQIANWMRAFRSHLLEEVENLGLGHQTRLTH